MGHIDELLDLMLDTMAYEPRSTVQGGFADEEGNPAYGTGVTITCRVVRNFQNRDVVNDAGKLVANVTAVYILNEGTLTFTVNDRYTLPDGSQPRPLRVISAPDEEGTVAVAILFEG